MIKNEIRKTENGETNNEDVPLLKIKSYKTTKQDIIDDIVDIEEVKEEIELTKKAKMDSIVFNAIEQAKEERERMRL